MALAENGENEESLRLPPRRECAFIAHVWMMASFGRNELTRDTIQRAEHSMLLDPWNVCDEPDHALIGIRAKVNAQAQVGVPDRKSTRLNSSHANISYAVF